MSAKGKERFKTWLFFLAATVLLAGCSVGGSTSASHGSFKNPLTNSDFADPFVLHVGKTYYAFSTTAMSEHFPTMHSTDLVHWTVGNDALPQLSGWAGGNSWHPAVLPRKDGKYLLYFTAQDLTSGRQCLGRALGTAPDGPYTDTSTRPFLCQTDIGGDIDPNPFRDSNGKYYLLWKNDGNCCGRDTFIWSQQTTPDGMTMLGKPVQLIHETKPWEYDVVEGPLMWKHDGKYYLFFSGNDYGMNLYAIGYATCSGPLGPCTQAPENPIVKSKCSAAGPGGPTIATDSAGQDWMLYAAWPTSAVGPSAGGPGRELWMDKLNWSNGKPMVNGPTCTRQDAPAP